MDSILNQASWLIHHGCSPEFAGFFLAVVEPVLVAAIIVFSIWFAVKRVARKWTPSISPPRR
jgi:hypothetical protein